MFACIKNKKEADYSASWLVNFKKSKNHQKLINLFMYEGCITNVKNKKEEWHKNG
jgi:hypothetical protein